MTVRKFLFWTHLIAGVIAGVVILFKSVTGVILAFENQIVEAVERDLRTVSVPVEGAVQMDLKSLTEKVTATKPKFKLGMIAVKSDPSASVLFGFGRDGGYYVNPYTGDVIGKESKTHDFMHWVEDMHRYFGNRPIGRPISGAATIIFFLICVTGIFIWWPASWSKKSLKRITVFNGKLTGKARDWNWHNVIGIWSLPFLLIIAGTGVLMSYQWANDLVYRMAGSEPPPPPNQQRPMGAGDRGAMKEEAPAPAYDFNALFAQARKQVPVWDTISLRLPQKAGGPVNVTILEEKYRFGIPKRSQLTLDATTADVKKWEPFSEISPGRRARIWARYLHTGEPGAWFGQFLAMLAAAGAAVLVWTGIALAWRRFTAWRIKVP